MDIDLALPLNMDILGNPLNWLMVTIILILVSYSAFVIYQNSTSLLPKV
jgi:hypothetical protein